MLPSRLVIGLLAAGLLLLSACSSSPTPSDPSWPSGLTLTAWAEPPGVSVAPQGASTGGCTQVTAELLNAANQLVDGIPVRFTASLGTFAGGGNATMQEVISVRGIAAVSFCAGATAGTGMVTVAAENAVTTVMIPIL